MEEVSRKAMGVESSDYCDQVGGMVKSHVALDEVEQFWSAHPCGSDQSSAVSRREYFQEIENRRYRLIRDIPEMARFGHFAGKEVLEVGCGIGTDGVQFARHGASYTGINLDAGSTQLAKECFAVCQATGTIAQMNAEAMSFPDNSFDHVYSLGVIHHTPHPERIVKEIHRVLRPGGSITVMIYNRSSINYHVEIMFLRKIFRLLLTPRFAPRFFAFALGLDTSKLDRHRSIMLSERMTPERWISINTDGPDCPLARVYSRAEALSLFRSGGFRELRTSIRFFNTEHYGYLGRCIPAGLADALGRRWGWSRWIEGRKPE
jgi:2-polyprenyl-3-methyl-5-hydroxy-6-metoxy-1,4-benzoquinol methylase